MSSIWEYSDEGENFSDGGYSYPSIDELYLKVRKLKVEMMESKQIMKSSKEQMKILEKEISDLLPEYKIAFENTKVPICNKAIDLIRSIKNNPPDCVKLILKAILVLKGIGPEINRDRLSNVVEDFWTPGQKILSGNFQEELESLRNPGNLSKINVEEFQTKIKTDPNWDPVKIKRSFPPIFTIYNWLLRIENFSNILSVIEEKELSWFFAKSLQNEKKQEIKYIRVELKRYKMAMNEYEAC